MSENSVRTEGASRYVLVNGLKMYYEIHGAGQPLVLLHGALSATGTSFGQYLPLLARDRQVIAVEQQAHGHTGDVGRPLSVAQLAEDTAGLLNQVGIRQADFFGYSLGAGIALHLAIRRPEVVRKLALASVTFNNAGFQPGLLEGLDDLQPEMLVGSPFHAEYLETAPNPGDFAVLVEKVREMNRSLPDWEPQDIQSIQAPALLAVGDADIVRPEHAVEMFRLLGGGAMGSPGDAPKAQLAVLPGTNHVEIPSRAGWLAPMISAFLDAPLPGAGR